MAGNFEEDFVVTPPVTPQVPPRVGGNAGSGSRVAGSPNQARKVEAGSKEPDGEDRKQDGTVIPGAEKS